MFSPTHNADLDLPVYAGGVTFPITGTSRAATLVFLGVERYRLLYLADLDGAKAGNARWQQAVALATSGDIGIAGGHVYVRTSKDSPRYEVRRMPSNTGDREGRGW